MFLFIEQDIKEDYKLNLKLKYNQIQGWVTKIFWCVKIFRQMGGIFVTRDESQNV